MSVAEMKLKAVEGLMRLTEEKAVQEILVHLAKLNDTSSAEKSAFMSHAQDIIKERSSVLEKLAQ